MKLKLLILIIILTIVITGCTTPQKTTPPTNNCPNLAFLDSLDNVPTAYDWAIAEQCAKGIPEGYEDVKYCEQDRDCVFQNNGCGNVGINRYNHVDNYPKKEFERSSYSPHCYRQFLPEQLTAASCKNNQCKLKLDCSNCQEVEEHNQKLNCDSPSVTVKSVCEQLEGCNC